ncbi:acetamidase/formamidase family protein [Bacillus sp. 03113]|uniref:acetamidase/formamidase family protein n=1 Tax=Bacillus sp. 03113 TaxID=2578211 RepID=UPI0015E8A39F|nr:acetamidase/formamidase family protein [Bacillus sp. 03113]
MHELNCDQFVFSFSGKHAPVLSVQSGDQVIIRTQDCFSGQIQSDDDLVTSMDYSRINPATGPIYVKEAEPGDILKVEILHISIGEKGVITTMPDIGTLIHQSAIRTKTVQIKEEKTIVFSDQIQFACSPMIGVIGVAPSEGEVACGHPGVHGGNLDSSCIGEGAAVYLPVFVPGALFGLGDLHASMGDGEMCGTGIEINGEVQVRLTLLKGEGKPLPTPIVETADAWYIISSHHEILKAIQAASEITQQLVAERLNIGMTDAYLLMGAVGDIRLSQCCKPCPVETVARVKMPKLIGMESLLGA